MNNNNQLPQEAVFVLSAILPGRQVGMIVNQVNHWLECNGPEWTVGRLKAITTASFQLRAGNHSVVLEIYKNNSISYRKSDLLIKGPFRVLMHNFLHAQRPQLIKKWAAGLRIHTAIKLPQLSEAQYLKSKKAINGSFSGDEKFLSQVVTNLETYIRNKNGKAIKVDSPDLGRLKAFSSYHRTIKAKQGPFEKMVASLVSSIRIPYALHDISGRDAVIAFHENLIEGGMADTQHHGHISFLQEGGCKGRVVAAPNAWVQYYTEPLSRALADYAKRSPRSAVHDQPRGSHFLNANQGKTLYCFDLSSATDRFPLETQLAVLRGFGLSEWCAPLKELCEKWMVNTPFGGVETWNYTVGQPMGMYASFALFHLTHLVLLDFLISEISRQGIGTTPKDSYMVLGDDVIINDLTLAKVYKSTMKKLGVELSATKSITSDLVSEFAGFLHVKTNRQYVTFRPYKHSGSAATRALNAISACGKSIGSKSVKWQEYYNLAQPTFSSRYHDLSPIVPNDDKIDGIQATGLSSNLLKALISRFLIRDPDGSFDAQYSCYGIELESDTIDEACNDFLLEETILVSVPIGDLQPPVFIPEDDRDAIPCFHEDSLIKEQKKIQNMPVKSQPEMVRPTTTFSKSALAGIAITAFSSSIEEIEPEPGCRKTDLFTGMEVKVFE